MGCFGTKGISSWLLGHECRRAEFDEAPDGHLLVINEEGFMELAGSEVVPHPTTRRSTGSKGQ